MSFPGTPVAITDIVATTIDSRTGEIADNVTNNNAILRKLKLTDRIKTFSGGATITHELSFQANGNASFYSGYDLLPVAAQDVISWAQYSITQAACPVVISGLEMLQNAGKEQIIDLLEGRIGVAEASMANLLATGLYSNGTGYSGKQIVGLGSAVPNLSSTSSGRVTTGVYGGIDPSQSTGTFWQNYYQYSGAATFSATTIQVQMNTLWSQIVRGADRPDLIVSDSLGWAAYLASLQLIQRFTQAETGDLGFPTLKFMDCDFVLDGGIGGQCPASTMFFLNTKYLKYRPHADRNMVPLSPNKRYAINQDAEVEIIGWAGNLTCGGRQFQGRLGCT
jgi:hypothetical protein